MNKGIILLVIAALAIPAMAGYNLGTVKLSNPYGYGGPYSADVFVDGVKDFDTFCVEFDDTFKPGTTYFATVDDYVLYSPGPDTNGNYTTLTDTAKMLYSAYLNDSLGMGQKVGHYYDIQEAIWQAQGSGIFNIEDADIYAAVNGDFTDLDITGWENVKVMNLWKYRSWEPADKYAYQQCDSSDFQSQLIRVGGGDNITVPAPGAVLLAGFGTSLVGVIRRRTL